MNINASVIVRIKIVVRTIFKLLLKIGKEGTISFGKAINRQKGTN